MGRDSWVSTCRDFAQHGFADKQAIARELFAQVGVASRLEVNPDVLAFR